MSERSGDVNGMVGRNTVIASSCLVIMISLQGLVEDILQVFQRSLGAYVLNQQEWLWRPKEYFATMLSTHNSRGRKLRLPNLPFELWVALINGVVIIVFRVHVSRVTFHFVSLEMNGL